MQCFIVFILLLFNCRLSSGGKAPFIANKHALALMPTKQILQIRGGAIDPKTLTDAMTVAAIGQGLLAMEAPETNLKLYGTEDDSVETQCMSRVMGAGILCIGITSFCLFTKNLETKEAVAWSFLVWVFRHGRFLINKEYLEVGEDPTGVTVWLAITIAGIYGCFTNALYADALLKVATSIWALNCIIAIVAPTTAAKIYAKDPDEIVLTEEQSCWTRGYGYENLAHCVLVLSLLNGVNKHRAMGFMSVPVIAHCAHILLGPDEFGTIGSIMVAFWLIFHGVNFASLAYN